MNYHLIISSTQSYRDFTVSYTVNGFFTTEGTVQLINSKTDSHWHYVHLYWAQAVMLTC